jgi:hypothetical protein
MVSTMTAAQGSTPLFDFPIFPVFAPQRDCFSEMPLLGDREWRTLFQLLEGAEFNLPNPEWLMPANR